MKAIIRKVGTIIDGEPKGWVFDCQGRSIAPIQIQVDGSVLHAGYTVAELTAIAKSDFSPSYP